MNAVDVLSFIVAGIGVLGGIITAYASWVSARSGSKSVLVQVSQFLQNEVRRLNDENDQLVQDKHQLQQENDRLNRLVRSLRDKTEKDKP